MMDFKGSAATTSGGRRLLLQGMLLAAASRSMAQPALSRPLRIGSSMPLTGPLAAHAQLLASGARLYVDLINRRGGVNGSMVELEVMDDEFNPDKAALNCRTLIQERDVLALMLNTGTAQIAACLPTIQKTGAPMFAPITGTPALRKVQIPQLFHVRASFRDELQYIVKHAKTIGIERIALFHTDDALGKSVLEELPGLLSSSGSQLAAAVGVPFRDGNIDQAAKDVWTHRPQAVVIGAAGSNFGKFVAAYRALGGANAQIYGLSVVDPSALGTEIAEAARGVVLTQVMPSTRNTVLPIVREYREALSKDRPGAEPSVLELDAFVSTKILVEGMRRAGRSPTRGSLITALETLGRYDSGGYVVTYTRENHSGSTFVDLAIVGANGKLRY